MRINHKIIAIYFVFSLLQGCENKEEERVSNKFPNLIVMALEEDVGAIIFVDGEAKATIKENPFLSLNQVNISLTPGIRTIEIKKMEFC